MANFKAVGVIPEDLNWQQREKKLHDAKQFIWDDPYLFKIVVDNLLRRCVTKEEVEGILWNCDKCQRTDTISKRHEMPLQGILQVEVFDCWGIYFVGPFPPSFNNEYILVVVDYVSKWVEALACPKNDSSTMIKFLKRQIFSHFGTPRVLISDGGSDFCNFQLVKVLKHYGVRHKKLDDALWAYRTTMKTTIGLSPFQMVYGKACHLLVEMEH
ncbi:uncharacterized protein K02A2.6-like [Vigna umbellata]|uniref:uncharacterized protein K02A2.6-like n=1 Tax=Vigna umbellata TaxID=87088 RepID=UPI001F5F63CE|nr:uncharacterized protein K02A2.6-like [Vigna umbellata]